MPARMVAANQQPEPAPRKKRGRFLRGVQILLSVLAMLLIPLAALVLSYGYGNKVPLREDAVNVFKDLAKLLGLT